MKLTEEEWAIGLLIGAGVALLSNPSKETDTKRHFHYSLSHFYDVPANGLVETIQVGPRLGGKDDTFISTSGLFDSGSAEFCEILFVSSTSAGGSGLPPEILNAYNSKHGGNIKPGDFGPGDEGAYVVLEGNPVYKFRNIPVVPGHVYQKRIVEHGTYTDYSLTDFTTNMTENFISRSTVGNHWTLAHKIVSPSALEWWSHTNYVDELSYLSKRWDVRSIETMGVAIIGEREYYFDLPISKRYIQIMHPKVDATGLPDGRPDDVRVCRSLETGIPIKCKMDSLKTKGLELFNQGLDVDFGYSAKKDRSVRDANIERFFA